jgi:transposase
MEVDTMRRAPRIELSGEDRMTLEGWTRAGTTPQRQAMRACLVLAAAAGQENAAIAANLRVRRNTVSKWRRRFAVEGFAGLQDRPRGTPARRYDDRVKKRILDQLQATPPAGFSRWNGRLVAEALGGVSPAHVWRVLRSERICLQRRRSWCVSTDPEFTRKAADITGLYLNPPDNAVVICVDEKPHIQALERAQGYLRFPDGRAMTGFSHEYTRHGTSTLFAALEVAVGRVKAAHRSRRRRREFLDFMNEVVADQPPGTDIHVVLDNLSTHKPANDRWLARHPRVHFHYTPTHASWLNMVELWFSLLSRHALRGASLRSVRQLRQLIDAYIAATNANPRPFEWRKVQVFQKQLSNNIANKCH